MNIAITWTFGKFSFLIFFFFFFGGGGIFGISFCVMTTSPFNNIKIIVNLFQNTKKYPILWKPRFWKFVQTKSFARNWKKLRDLLLVASKVLKKSAKFTLNSVRLRVLNIVAFWNTFVRIRYRVFHETWQLVNNFKCLLPYFFKFFDIQRE